MTYRNAPEAIKWLCRVFGFEKDAVYPGPEIAEAMGRSFGFAGAPQTLFEFRALDIAPAANSFLYSPAQMASVSW
jgi:uncharacterized glyoxalase superfamily protein PhnB